MDFFSSLDWSSPWIFALLLILPLLFWLQRRRGRAAAVQIPAAAAFAELPQTWRLRARGLPLFLRFFALVLLIAALARPREGSERIIEKRQGVAMEMVLDRSGSMQETFSFRGKKTDRLQAAKAVFRDFILGGGGLPGRINDLVGLIVYARYADTICPLTLAHDALPQFLEQVQMADSRDEDGTAIGDALALAAARLFNAEKELAARRTGGAVQGKEPVPADYTIKSKIIILLTDGIDNCSRTAPAEAVKLCQKWGIKIYTVAVGGENSGRYINTPFGRMPIGGGAEVDTELLKNLAEATEGRFFFAADGGSLREIYAAIDELEKTEISAVRFADYAERFMPFALAALGCLLAEFILRCTWLRVNS